MAMELYTGVVENRADPLHLGRCQVRIVGLHTDDKTILPTEDLPWATPLQPITSAANSGIGSSPLGPIEGTWVIGFFLDGEDCQQPAMFGTISTKAAKQTFVRQNADATPRKETNNPNELDWSGISTYSTFTGRIFLRSGFEGTANETYSTNYVIDDISFARVQIPDHLRRQSYQVLN